MSTSLHIPSLSLLTNHSILYTLELLTASLNKQQIHKLALPRPGERNRCEISGPHLHDYEEYFRPGCDAVQSGRRLQRFRRNIVPPYSGYLLLPWLILLLSMYQAMTVTVRLKPPPVLYGCKFEIMVLNPLEA
jgi:hypothetical protein